MFVLHVEIPKLLRSQLVKLHKDCEHGLFSGRVVEPARPAVTAIFAVLAFSAIWTRSHSQPSERIWCLSDENHTLITLANLEGLLKQFRCAHFLGIAPVTRLFIGIDLCVGIFS